MRTASASRWSTTCWSSAAVLPASRVRSGSSRSPRAVRLPAREGLHDWCAFPVGLCARPGAPRRPVACVAQEPSCHMRTRNPRRVPLDDGPALVPSANPAADVEPQETSSYRLASLRPTSRSRPRGSASTCLPDTPRRNRSLTIPAPSPACRSGIWVLSATGHPARISRGPEVRARVTVIAEGARGSLAKRTVMKYGLDRDSDPQTYGLGFKELWQLPPGRAEPGLIQHTIGWPVDGRTYGGSLSITSIRSVLRRLRRGPRLSRSALQTLRGVPAIQASPEIRALLHEGSFSPMAREPSLPVAGSRCRSSKCLARYSQAAPAAWSERAEDQGRASGDPLRDACRPNIWRKTVPARDSTRAGAHRRAASSYARFATSSRVSSAACGRGWPTVRSKP